MTRYCGECLPEKKRANYGPKMGETPTCCSMHGKAHGFIDVTHTRCDHDKCKELPVYGAKGEQPTHCGKHKLPDTINVVNKRCEDDGCNERAIYGFKGGKRTRCRTHKLPKMIDVVSQRCKHVGCDEFTHYGIKADKKRIRCHAHKTEKMVLLSQRCTSCDTTCTQQKDKLCSACRQVQTMGASRKLIRIERRIIAMLILHGTIIDDDRTKFNKSIGAECGGYRPDIYINCGTFILVIEIDENQHRPRYISRIVDGVVTPMVVGSYSTECENKRMMSIVSKEQMPVYFIRINPDKCTIDDKDIKVSFEKRCEALRTLIKSVMDGGKPAAWMTVTYMYYDGALLRTETPNLPAGF